MGLVTLNHFSGGSRLTPGGSAGLPHLAKLLRDGADDLALAAANTRLQVETVPLASNLTGLLLFPAESIESVYATTGGTPAPKTLIPTGETVAAGECEVAADRRTMTFLAADSHTVAVVAYMRRMETAATLQSSAETYDLDDGFTLLVKVDGAAAQTALFETADFSNIDLATAAEVAAVINSDITGATAEDRNGVIVMRSDQEGYNSSGVLSSLEVTGGTGNVEIGFSTTLTQGTGVSTQSA